MQSTDADQSTWRRKRVKVTIDYRHRRSTGLYIVKPVLSGHSKNTKNGFNLCFRVLCFSCFCVCSLLPCGHLLVALVGDVYCILFPDLYLLSYFQYQLSLDVDQKYCRMLQGEHSATLSTFIKLPFVFKTFFSILSGRLRQVLM